MLKLAPIPMFFVMMVLSACIDAGLYQRSVQWSKSDSLDPNFIVSTHLKPASFIEKGQEFYNSRAESCLKPKTAKLSDGTELAYGCFCGVRHPSIDLPSGILKQSPQIQRDYVIANLLEIRPVDDIDGACQRHDLCVAEFNQHFDCNIVFMKQMMKYNTRSKLRYGRNLSAPQKRCVELASDLGAVVASSFATSDRGDYGLFPEYFSTFLPLYGGISLANKAFTEYPLKNERCN